MDYGKPAANIEPGVNGRVIGDALSCTAPAAILGRRIFYRLDSRIFCRPGYMVIPNGRRTPPQGYTAAAKDEVSCKPDFPYLCAPLPFTDIDEMYFAVHIWCSYAFSSGRPADPVDLYLPRSPF